MVLIVLYITHGVGTNTVAPQWPCGRLLPYFLQIRDLGLLQMMAISKASQEVSRDLFLSTRQRGLPRWDTESTPIQNVFLAIIPASKHRTNRQPI